MTTRLLEVILPADRKGEVEELLEKDSYIDVWYLGLSDGNVFVRILSLSENIDDIVDALKDRFSDEGSFRIIIHVIDATIPHPEETEQKGVSPEEKKANGNKAVKYGQVTREELYEKASENVKITREYLAMMILSSVVAVIGVLYDSTAIIIGAMVIAPMLGPNIALSLSATLGDKELAMKAFKSSAIGIGIALLIAFLAGVMLRIDPTLTEISSRTDIGYGYVVLALAAGGAGVLAITTGISSAIVGVTVAVAMLPPLVVFGLLLGDGQAVPAFGALLLFLVNLIAINLAGVVTFSLQGVRPGRWWEIDSAKRTTNYALSVWLILLTLMIVIIYISQ